MQASRKRPNRIAMPEEVQTFEWKLDLHTPATGGDGVRTRRDAYETINAPQGWFIRRSHSAWNTGKWRRVSTTSKLMNSTVTMMERSEA